MNEKNQSKRIIFNKKRNVRHGNKENGVELMIDISRYSQKDKEALSQKFEETIFEFDKNLNKKTTNELDSNQIAIRKQLDSNQIAIRKQLDSKIDSKEISFEADLAQENPEAFTLEISGNEKKVMQYLFNNICRTHHLIIKNISSKNLSGSLEIKENVLKNVIHRLVKKQLIIRYPGVSGRGGRLNLRVPQPVFNAMLTENYELYDRSKINQLDSKIDSKPPSSSSSSIKPTPKSPSFFVQNMNLSRMERLGFRKGHFEQIEKECALWEFPPTFEQAQESFDHFCNDVEKGLLRIKTTPVKFYLGTLVKKKMLYVTDDKTYQKNEAHEMLTINNQEKTQEDEQIKQENEAFENWIKTQSETELDAIAGNVKSFFRTIAIRSYYVQNVKTNLKGQG